MLSSAPSTCTAVALRRLAVTGVRQVIEVNCSLQTLFEVITEYEKYPQFLPDMEVVTVLNRAGDSADVEFRLNLIKRFRYVLRLTSTAPDSVSWKLVEGLFERNQGSWNLTALGDSRTRAEYYLDVAVGMFVPGAVSKRLVRKTLPKTLDAFKVRAESVALGGGS